LYIEAVLHPLKGQFLLLLSPGNQKEAESSFRQAITVACSMKSRSAEESQ
jgi:hypothetical protein